MTDIVAILKSAVAELASLARKKRVTVHIDVHTKFQSVLVDKNRIKEVYTNLLSNAIKYNKPGGRVDISVFDEDTKLFIEFRDTGYGIPKGQQKDIFKKFFRADMSSTNTVLGTGLGLFLTRILVEKMGGVITFSSVEGGGTTFAISFPHNGK